MRIKAVENTTFKEFWEEHFEREDVNTLTSLIYMISKERGDGIFDSYLVVLNHLVD